MLRYALQRIALTIPLLIGLSILVFVFVRLLPGDPVTAMLGVFQNPDLAERLRHRYGFDRPILEQYFIWASALLRGDFGLSVRSQMEIGPLILARLPATLELLGVSMLLTILLAIPGGIAAGMAEGRRPDRFISLAAIVALGMPAFFIGILLLAGAVIALRLPLGGGYVPFAQDPVANLRAVLLPSLAIAIASAPYLLRLTRAAVIDVRKEPFVAYADAKGLRERTIYVRYIIRNVLPSIVGVLGLYVGFLLAGSLTVEVLFGWPGMARLLVGSVTERDYALLQAMVLFLGVAFVLINLTAELVQAVLDPRIRLR